MQFHPTLIAGVMEVSIDWHRDGRGAFGRAFCRREIAAHGLNPDFAQSNISTNPVKGTVRGFHLQHAPHAETKLVQCVRGRILDVALDLRAGSPTHGRHHAVELSADNGRMLYVPHGCAHAYQTLEHNSSVIYFVSEFYSPECECGVRWNDPAIAVPWPIIEGAVVSERDRALPLLADYEAGR